MKTLSRKMLGHCVQSVFYLNGQPGAAARHAAPVNRIMLKSAKASLLSRTYSPADVQKKQAVLGNVEREMRRRVDELGNARFLD